MSFSAAPALTPWPKTKLLHQLSKPASCMRYFLVEAHNQPDVRLLIGSRAVGNGCRDLNPQAGQFSAQLTHLLVQGN